MDPAYLSLNAFKIRSTSTSRWKALASRLRILSRSTLVACVDVVGSCLPPDDIVVGWCGR